MKLLVVDESTNGGSTLHGFPSDKYTVAIKDFVPMVNHNAARRKPAEPVFMNPDYISLECKWAKSFMACWCPRVHAFMPRTWSPLPLANNASFLCSAKLASTMDHMTLPSPAPTHNEREEAAHILTDMSDQGSP
ncbi:hypothetical protein FCOIX_8291 [Fusarium coicis]|nr:hypothetical protein FCOIX_8291 [Fusarium coicis]